MIYTLATKQHDSESIRRILSENPQICFVSLSAIDIYGHDTDEKIPVSLFLKDPDKFLEEGIQTDGSSVLLPLIADISDGNVKLIPDRNVNWYVDYNYDNFYEDTKLPVGTLRIPAFLVHNKDQEVGSRVILRNSLRTFKDGLMATLLANPYVFDYLNINSASEIEEISLTAATELEFYVKTPHEVADKERLHASQEMKEQYWKRTVGPVRTALEQTLCLMDKYGFCVEMGHKEVGGAGAEMMQGGDFGHIMEQLEIDWKYAEPMQACDNDNQVRYIVKDVFRQNGMAVSFLAKPVEGVAGSGKHVHIAVCAKLKDGRMVNLYEPRNGSADLLSPIGFGAIMGLLKNYEVINPLANCTSDALRRLKPGYEAPVCSVVSLGKDADKHTRNRTVLACLIRDEKNPLATRFELRSPNPKSNTYLVIAACLLAMLDGIKASLNAKKTSQQLMKSVSKAYGEEDFYLEAKRVYRAEEDIFKDFSDDERAMLFGPSPSTVWDNIKAFDLYPEKTRTLLEGNSFSTIEIESFKIAAKDQWISELTERIVPALRKTVKECCIRLHDGSASDLDEQRYQAICLLAKEIAQDTSERECLLTTLLRAADNGDYTAAADLQVKTIDKVAALEAIYSQYRKNILC